MKENLNSVVQNKRISAIVSILMGLLLIFLRTWAVATLVRITGIFALVCAGAYIAMYLMGEKRDSVQLLAVIIAGVIGLIFTVAPGVIVGMFPILMGILLLFSGITNLAQAMQLDGDVSGKMLSVILSVLVIILGILAIFRPFAIADVTILFLGAAMVASGITDLWVMRSAA